MDDLTKMVMVPEHLHHNIYPPIYGMDGPAIAAIEAVDNGDSWDVIDSMYGPLYAGQIVEMFHLEGFLEEY